MQLATAFCHPTVCNLFGVDVFLHLLLHLQLPSEMLIRILHNLVQFIAVCNFVLCTSRIRASRHVHNSGYSIVSSDTLQFGVDAFLHLLLLRQFPSEMLTRILHNLVQYVAVYNIVLCMFRTRASRRVDNSDSCLLSSDIWQTWRGCIPAAAPSSTLSERDAYRHLA